MRRRYRAIISILVLGGCLLAVGTIDFRVRGTLHLRLQCPTTQLRVFYDTGEGYASTPDGERPAASPEKPVEVVFEVPPKAVRRIRLSWGDKAVPITLGAVTLRKLWRTWTVPARVLPDVVRPIGGLEPIQPSADGVVLLRPTSQDPALEFAPQEMDRFSVIGVRFLVPLCLLFAGLLYIVLGLPYGRWWRFRELILNLTRVNLTLKYRGSFLGFCWSLLNPILMVVIYSIAFRYIMRIQLDNYTFFLISGLLPWNFLSMTLMSSTTSVLGNAGLLQKAAFPREVFPISTSLFVFVQFLLALVAIGPFCLMWKTDFVWINALYLVAVVALLVFSVGLAFLLSALTVIYRDVQHFTEVVVMALFWLTPIVYSFEHIPARFRWLFLLNPVTIFTNGFHDFIYWNRNPDAVTWIGILIWPLATLAVGALVFRRIDPRFAEVL